MSTGELEYIGEFKFSDIALDAAYALVDKYWPIVIIQEGYPPIHVKKEEKPVITTTHSEFTRDIQIYNERTN